MHLQFLIEDMSGEVLIRHVMDNDRRNTEEFREELEMRALWSMVSIDHVFCIAVEEMEAWLLGDREAVFKAYPNAREGILFVKDCPTYREIGKYKSKWADNIGKYMNLETNKSPSFKQFIQEIQMRVG